MEKLLKATHEGKLPIANQNLTCAVLENGTRVITKNAIFRAFGRTKRGRKKDEIRVLNMPAFIDANNLQPYINNELKEVLILVKYINKNGKETQGYKAEIIPMLCDVYLQGDYDGKLTKFQRPLAKASQILLKGFAHVGIIALVDEATGYQEIRDKLALQKILDKYLLAEYAKWARRFPPEFYKEMFRLKNWTFNEAVSKRPGVVGRYTNNIVYERLAPGVLEELKKLNPKNEKGNRKVRHHQYLTEDVGHPKLQEHILGTMALMRASSNWNVFIRLVERSYPKFGHTIPIGFDEII